MRPSTRILVVVGAVALIIGTSLVTNKPRRAATGQQQQIGLTSQVMLPSIDITTTMPEASVDPIADDAWVLPGFSAWNTDVAYQWIDPKVGDCKAYQESCYKLKVTTHLGCPGGVYILLSILDAGTVVGSANDITGGLRTGETATAALEMPGGNPPGAKARVSKLQCLR